MKKIFWTTIVWFIIIFLFRVYLRLFDKPLGREVSSRFGIPQQICPIATGTASVDLTQQLDAIQNQLTTLTEQFSTEHESKTEDTLFHTTAPTKVALYYFNQTEDQKLSSEQQVNIHSILPVYRIFPASKNLLLDTLKELIRWNLTNNEKEQWFITEFPHPKFDIISWELLSDGTLNLQFTEVPGFTDGWSARMLILSSVIEKTAGQFPGVKHVVFLPETLFQP